ncbi:hypothetical protein Fbal_2131 [Ferrimonas balearica DSM 9799]|uniref:Uncharacterized protein n=1 Tax=Ferrimonas balearica (strain DSM 9799 / CCM 4581 / KCTC 23876 / PAT) TaxID=550540 RepID=E1SV07_FERBD|nr:hypothetical protein [Ferrimonas balearica]ADN76334.1 hypothetical protein Fbal_2131 [Ferrimonas balearica DSM 9799]MBY5980859.1 hypothetical protein [Ferrimonas balearica]
MTLSELDIAVVLLDGTESPGTTPQDVDACLTLSLDELIEQAENWPGMVAIPQQMTA